MSEAVIRDELLPLAEALPASPMESIQQNFQHVETKWGAKALLAVNSLEALKALLEEVAAADRADGFRRIIADGDERDALFYVQLNTTNEREFRPYRIVRSSEGEFLLYGHPKLYEVTGEGENDALKAMIEELIVIGREEGDVPGHQPACHGPGHRTPRIRRRGDDEGSHQGCPRRTGARPGQAA